VELIRRIRRNTEILDNGCWNWTGHVNAAGYGKLCIDYKMRRAHRVTYELFKGAIPSGLVIDHLCRNRKCVNPDHLEAVPLKENVLRGEGLSALNSRKTVCVRGHMLSEDNVYRLRGKTTRICKTCRKAQMKSMRGAA